MDSADSVLDGSGEECPSGHVLCSGYCVDISSDHDHCGSCGHACEPVEVCADGECRLECPAGDVPCSGSCVDIMSDIDNCGACGVVCSAGVTGEAVCEDGVCSSVCLEGWSDSDEDGFCEQLIVGPVEDTWVGCGNSNEGTNFGREVIFSTYGSYTSWNAFALLKFPLDLVPSDVTIGSVTVNVYVYRSCCFVATTTVGLYYYSDNGWDENTVTWNSRPSGLPGTMQSSLSYDGTSTWRSFSAQPSSIEDSIAEGYVTYVLHDDSGAIQHDKCYRSSEAPSFNPYLEITLDIP